DQRVAAQPNRAGARADEPGDRVQHRRLARAVRPDQPDDLRLADRQREVAHGRDRAVVDPEPLHVEDSAHVSCTADSPRYAAVTSRLRRISSGVPDARVLPWSSTWIRSQTSMISAMLWSMRSTPALYSSRTVRMTAAKSGTSASGRPAAGSSIRTKRGAVASARATPSFRSSPCASVAAGRAA